MTEKSTTIITIGSTHAVFKSNLFYTTIDTDDIDPDAVLINSDNLYADFRTITTKGSKKSFEFQDVQPLYELEDVKIINERISEAADSGNLNHVIEVIDNESAWDKSEKRLYEKLLNIKELILKEKQGEGKFSIRHINDIRYVCEITQDLIVLDSVVYYLEPI